MNEITYKALLVANSRFDEDPHNLLNLKGPPNDIRALEDVLIHPQIGLHSHENITSLLECNSFEIMEKLEEFFSNGGRDDQLLFYYSGHGRLDKFESLYLCARNTKTSNLVSTAIPDFAINSMIQNSNSKRIIIILDCCHSGRFKGSIDIPKNLAGEGRFVISSSRSRELSEDAKTTEDFSPFTKHFVKALLSSEVDVNQDNFVSLNEVYDYVLPRLQDETKQIPQRNFSGAVGELAISKSVVSKKIIQEISRESAGLPPRLAVSATNIEIKDVSPDEKLPEEIIDVYNEGGGQLEWEVECNDEWIKIEKFKGYFSLKFNPKPGNNRGRIFVREKLSGGSKLIQVLIQMKEAKAAPLIEVFPDKLEFGKLILNSTLPRKTIRITNKGGGTLNPRITSTISNFIVNITNDLIEVSPDVRKAGDFSEDLIVDSDGGKVKIRLSASIEAGPIIEVSPKQINFGTIYEGETKNCEIIVKNIGSSKLDWKYEYSEGFFTVKRNGDSLKVSICAEAGKYHGVIYIKSNGGDITFNIKGEIKFKEQPQIDISGTWNFMGMSKVELRRMGNGYKYLEYNVMGVCCSEGTLTPEGDHYLFRAHNILAGQVTGIFWAQQNFINAQYTVLGQVYNGVLNRIF